MSEIDIKNMPALKFDEIQNCAKCGKGLMHNNQMFFYRIKVEQGAFDLAAIQRMAGLELVMGGAAPLARVFSPDTVCARFMPTITKLICGDCFITHPELANLIEPDET